MANSHMNRIASQKVGTDMLMALMIRVILSKALFLYFAESIPSVTPITREIAVAMTARDAEVTNRLLNSTQTGRPVR